MNAYKFEYIWLDGYQPEANLRSKTKIISFESFNKDISKLLIGHLMEVPQCRQKVVHPIVF